MRLSRLRSVGWSAPQSSKRSDFHSLLLGLRTACQTLWLTNHDMQFDRLRPAFQRNDLLLGERVLLVVGDIDLRTRFQIGWATFEIRLGRAHIMLSAYFSYFLVPMLGRRWGDLDSPGQSYARLASSHILSREHWACYLCTRDSRRRSPEDLGHRARYRARAA
jgi:hypothetical protein